MPLRHYFVSDDAYSASRQMAVPFSGSHGFRSSKDNFNFFQSSTRINIECAFGILVRRWGVLWRRQEGSLQRINSIVMACLYSASQQHFFRLFTGAIPLRAVISAFSCLAVHLHSLSVLPKPDIEKNWWTVQVSKPAQESAGAAGAEACEQAR